MSERLYRGNLKISNGYIVYFQVCSKKKKNCIPVVFELRSYFSVLELSNIPCASAGKHEQNTIKL